MPGRGKRLHVVKNAPGRWDVKPEGQPVITTAPTQGAAEAIAKQILQQTPGGGQVTIHRPDGTIRDSDTINRPDPNPPRDKQH